MGHHFHYDIIYCKTPRKNPINYEHSGTRTINRDPCTVLSIEIQLSFFSVSERVTHSLQFIGRFEGVTC